MSDRNSNTKENENIENLANMSLSLAKAGFRGIDMSMELASELVNRFNSIGKNKKCGCSGNCHCNDGYDSKYVDELCGDCMPCGAPNSTTDLKVVARLGEVRKLSFVLENNLNKASNYTIKASELMDQCGNEHASKAVIFFPSQTGTLEPCKSVKIDFLVKIPQQLPDNSVFYAEIEVDGTCCANKFSLGIWVQDDCLTDHLVLCDPCRKQKSEFVQFNNCNCCDDGEVRQGKKYYRL
jgi:hypothetical protein